MKLSRTHFLSLLFLVVAANYAAQLPYYVHQYYTPHKFLPDLAGTILLSATLIWFLIAFRLLTRGKRSGYYLLQSFLVVEFLFYLQTQISQWMVRHQLFLYVYHPHGLLLFIVFGIGYINFFASLYFMIYLLLNRAQFIEASNPKVAAK